MWDDAAIVGIFTYTGRKLKGLDVYNQQEKLKTPTIYQTYNFGGASNNLKSDNAYKTTK